MDKRKIIISLICNLLIVGMEIAATIIGFCREGFSMYTYYTEDSNFLTMVACAIYSVFLILALKKGKEIPLWANILKFVSTCCLALTFFVVIFVLAPTMGDGIESYRMLLFTNSMIFTHLLCPLVAMASCIFFDMGILPIKKSALFAVIPSLVYAAITIPLNILKVMEGPYPFLKVYQQAWWASVLWCVGILAFDFLFAMGMAVLRKKFNKQSVQIGEENTAQKTEES